MNTPVSVITNYIDWNLVGAGQSVVITGSAVDPDKGWIGGVELSADGGNTWNAQPAVRSGLMSGKHRPKLAFTTFSIAPATTIQTWSSTTRSL